MLGHVGQVVIIRFLHNFAFNPLLKVWVHECKLLFCLVERQTKSGKEISQSFLTRLFPQAELAHRVIGVVHGVIDGPVSKQHQLEIGFSCDVASLSVVRLV